MFEYSLIKQHRPRFNVRLVDDKSYPFLAVTLSDEWPRAQVMRGRRRKGTRYFGPYAHAYAIRDTLDELLRTFPVRTCSDAKLRRHERLGKPCLLFHIEKCSGPCVGEIDKAGYDRLVAELMDFLDGDHEPVLQRLEAQMAAAATEMEFEQAGRLRDRLATVRRAIERQQMVGDRNEDFDVLGVAEDELEAAAQVFFVRRGRVVGRFGFFLDKVMDLSAEQTMAAVLEQVYGDEPAMGYPRRCWCRPCPRTTTSTRSGWGSRGAAWSCGWPGGGPSASLPPPSCGTPRKSSTATASSGRPTTTAGPGRSTSWRSPSGCPRPAAHRVLRHEPPPGHRLRGLDGGARGRPAPLSEYRRFKVKGVAGNDDFAAMEEVLTRRLTNYLQQGRAGGRAREVRLPAAVAGRRRQGPARGGGGVLDCSAWRDEIPVASLAKRFEEVYLPDRSDPVEVRRGSEALFLLQRLRDESHRFAISYHRQLRGKRMTASVLDDIPGLGEKRKQRLVEELGGVRAVRHRRAGAAEGLRWLPDSIVVAVYEKLHAGRLSSEDTAACRPQARDADPWEAHAEWWQREFTDGADLEYVEQILPLIAQHLAGAGGCSTSAAARARWPAWPRRVRHGGRRRRRGRRPAGRGP